MTLRRPTARAILLVLVLAGALVAGTLVIAAASTVAALGAAAACLVRAGRRRGRMRVAWGCLGLGALAFALGGGTLAHPGPGYLAMIPLAAAGLLAVPIPDRSLVDRFRGMLDTALVGLSLVTLSFYLVLEPHINYASPALIYPVGDVLLGTVALVGMSRLRRGAPEIRPITLAGAGILVIAVADGVAYAGAQHAAVAAMVAGFAALLLAAVLPQPDAEEAGPDEQRTITILLPYVVVAVGLIVGIIRISLNVGPSPLGTWTRSLSILLIVLRQVLLLIENRRLARHLESRVAERAAELHARELRFRALIEQSTDSLAILERDSTVRYQSESVERIFGYPASSLVGHRFAELAGRRVGARVMAAIAEVADTPGATTVYEIMLKHADGQYRLAETTITNLLHDPYVNGLVFNTRDISEAHELQDQLRHEAYHDALTGLVNRAGVPGAAGRGGGPARVRRSGGRPVPGPGRVQGDQRQSRPRRRRPAAGPGRRAAARLPVASRRWWPAWAATSSR